MFHYLSTIITPFDFISKLCLGLYFSKLEPVLTVESREIASVAQVFNSNFLDFLELS